MIEFFFFFKFQFEFVRKSIKSLGKKNFSLEAGVKAFGIMFNIAAGLVRVQRNGRGYRDLPDSVCLFRKF